jgi:hypothetical protein
MSALLDAARWAMQAQGSPGQGNAFEKLKLEIANMDEADRRFGQPHYGHHEDEFPSPKPQEFKPFQKIGRLTRGITITEKLDGSNAQITIVPVLPDYNDPNIIARIESPTGSFAMYAGSRTRWITPGKTTDNFGFARWAQENCTELFMLGEGTHFGEWYGAGIQRGYGLTEKRFALFNVGRWSSARAPLTEGKTPAPACCELVPVLYEGVFTMDAVNDALSYLQRMGSLANTRDMVKAEGIVIYHHAIKQYFKKTLDKDDEPKGLQDTSRPKITLDQMARG